MRLSRFVAAIKADLDLLLTFPLTGAPCEHLAPNPRVKVHSPYAVYYFRTEREVVVVRVLHGARDIAAIAERGGFAE